MTRKQRRPATFLQVEELEGRILLSHFVGIRRGAVHALAEGNAHALLQAGDKKGAPPDSPAERVDPNTPDSPFAGVGSILVATKRKNFICTGTSLDLTHVLTAAHCLDLNDDGASDNRDKIRSVEFNLNIIENPDGDRVDIVITGESWVLHPDYTGFDHPSLNDDLAIITLATTLPSGVPTYELHTSPLVKGVTQLIMVGYGQSGDGFRGFTVDSSYTMKRLGENVVDDFYQQDDQGRGSADEVFRFDFDGPVGNGPMGGPTLGNMRETTLGGGDSGGPSFILVGSDPGLATSYQIVGVNTFSQGRHTSRFNSEGGGMSVPAYADWIVSTLGSTD
jgi:Trypsin